MKKIQIFGYLLLALVMLSSCEKVKDGIDDLNTVEINDVEISETIDIDIVGDKASGIIISDGIPFSDTIFVDLNEIEELEPYILNKVTSVSIDFVNYTITNVGDDIIQLINIRIVELDLTTVIENIVVGEQFQLDLTPDQLNLICNHLLSTRTITFEISGIVSESPAHFEVNINSMADIEFFQFLA